MDFQAVARPHCFKVNREKILMLPTKSSIQVHTQYVSLKYPRIFQTDLGSLDPSYRENLMEQTFWCLFACPCECGGFPYCNTVRGNCYWKMTCKQGFSSSVLLAAHRMLGKLCFFDKRHKKRVFFRHLSIRSCIDSKMWELQVCTEDLISRLIVSMFPCSLQVLLTHS